MSKFIKISPLLIASLLCLGLLVYLYLPNTEKQTTRTNKPTPVNVVVAREQPFNVVVEALGTAKANESVNITPQTDDIVEQVLFDDGDNVNAGQLLITLKNHEEKARLAALEANLQEAKQNLIRVKNLAKNSVASKQLLDERIARVKALNAERDIVKAQLNQLQISAPFNGVLGVRNISEGAYVRPGDVLTTLDDISVIKLDFQLAENHLASVNVGQLIEATSIAYKDELFSGKITSISSRVDPVTRAVEVRAKIDNQSLKLRPGMFLQIRLQTAVLNTLILPEASLIPIEDKHYVFVIKDNKAIRKQVSIGLRKPGFVQITSGVNIGEEVVIEGALKLRVGSSVNVLNRSTEKE